MAVRLGLYTRRAATRNEMSRIHLATCPKPEVQLFWFALNWLLGGEGGGGFSTGLYVVARHPAWCLRFKDREDQA